VVNCAALPEPLLESELFGHVKGAFTGALSNKKGLCEEAQGGTLFLDEIGDMSLSLQSKLLRLIQEREVRPVGGIDPYHVDVRIVAATNQPLDQRVKQGFFREDLYYRLCVIKMTIPPLRERREDIPLLADYFLRRYAQEMNRPGLVLSRSAVEYLCRHSWPGNVRELEHAIEQTVVLTTNKVILPEDLPESVRAPQFLDDGSLPPFRLMSLHELQKRYLKRVLRETAGNRSKAAKILGVARKTLYRMVKRHGL
jgi:two-component system, NtrC family, response regulator AtoC